MPFPLLQFGLLLCRAVAIHAHLMRVSYNICRLVLCCIDSNLTACKLTSQTFVCVPFLLFLISVLTVAPLLIAPSNCKLVSRIRNLLAASAHMMHLRRVLLGFGQLLDYFQVWCIAKNC